ncbi:MAG: carboxymuconolactone decarboxylase family protein [Bryobacteraceae bacterium]
MRDIETSQLSEAEKALFRFVRKVNEDSVSIQPADIEALHAAGYSDEAIYYAITVCALFNFYNRWIDASGVHPMSDEAHRAGGKRSAIYGYSRSSQPAPQPPAKK